MTAQMYTLAFYVIAMVTGRLMSQTQRKAKDSVLSQTRALTQDWTALLTAVAAALAIGLPVLEYTWRAPSNIKTFSILAGVAIILTGHGIAYAANRQIGDSWSPTIDKTPGQLLVTSGVYSTIRHPLYLSGILLSIGTNVYFGSTWAWIVALLFLAAIGCRIPIEERRLTERFGPAYTSYQEHTKAILPWVL